MSIFEIIIAIVGGLMILPGILGFLYIATDETKQKLDPENKKGCSGYVIAFVIVIAILFLIGICLRNSNGEPNYRHSEVISNIQTIYSV